MENDIKINIVYLNSKNIIYDSFVRIDYTVTNNSDKEILNLRFRLFDPFFDINLMPFFIDVSHHKNQSDAIFFVSFPTDIPEQFERVGYRGGFKLTVENLDSGEIVYNNLFKFNFKIPDYRISKNKYSIDDPRMWIFGDSHVGTSFGEINNCNIFKIKNYVPVRCAFPLLTINRFINGNYIDFLNMFPILTQDIIVFYLGEIDLRYVAMKVSSEKNISTKFVIKKLIFDYINVIEKIKKEYSTKIIILSPNPTCRFSQIKPELSKYIQGTDQERADYRRIFDDHFKEYSNISNNVFYLDWTADYKDCDGLNLTSQYYPNDIHIKNHEPMISCINKFLELKNI